MSLLLVMGGVNLFCAGFLFHLALRNWTESKTWEGDAVFALAGVLSGALMIGTA